MGALKKQLVVGLGLFLLSACNTTNYYPMTLTLSTNPVVFNTAFSYLTPPDSSGDQTTVTIEPAWFQINKWTFNNSGSSEVVIISLLINVVIPPDPNAGSSSGSSSGSSTPAASSIGTCTISPTVDSSGTSSTVASTYLLDIPAGQSASLPIQNYCQGLSFDTTVLTTSYYQTSGTVIVEGWLGSPSSPSDRLELAPISFNTQ